MVSGDELRRSRTHGRPYIPVPRRTVRGRGGASYTKPQGYGRPLGAHTGICGPRIPRFRFWGGQRFVSSLHVLRVCSHCPRLTFIHVVRLSQARRLPAQRETRRRSQASQGPTVRLAPPLRTSESVVRYCVADALSIRRSIAQLEASVSESSLLSATAVLGTWLSRLWRVERFELLTKRLVINDSNC